jgi:Cu/Ag efflux protein CusF
MMIARVGLAGVAALIMIGSVASAEQQAQTGLLTMVDRLTRTVTIQKTQGGTVGANSTNPTGSAEEYKVQDNLSLEDVHAGDRINYTLAQSNGSKTITKIEKQK